MVSGKSQKETARHTSEHNSLQGWGNIWWVSHLFRFLISFISFQVASYFGCSLSCAPTTSIWFIFCLISLCVYLYFVGATLYFILGLLCMFPLPSSAAGTQYLGCRVDYSLAPPSSTISPVMNRGDYQLLPLPPSNINIVLSSPSLSSIINYPAWERRLSFLRWFLHYLRLAPSSIILFFSSPDYLCFAATCKTQASPHCYYRMKRQKTW